MDGYRKNKMASLRSVRTTMFWKYGLTFPLLLFAAVWLLAACAYGPTECWKSAEAVYSHISYESVGLSRGRFYVLNTEDGRRFVIPPRREYHVSAADWEQRLSAGEPCTIVYAETAAGGDRLQALSSSQGVLLDRSVSAAVWEKDRRGCFLALYITLALEAAALLLIDRLWCRKEHAAIRKLRQDMARRKEKTERSRAAERIQ